MDKQSKLNEQRRRDIEELMALPEESQNLLLAFAAGLVTGGQMAGQTA